LEKENTKHKGIKLVSVLYSNSDIMQGVRATEDMLTANPKLAGIFAANEGGAVGAARALDLRRLGGKVEPMIDTGVTVVTMRNFAEPAVQKILYPTGKE